MVWLGAGKWFFGVPRANLSKLRDSASLMFFHSALQAGLYRLNIPGIVENEMSQRKLGLLPWIFLLACVCLPLGCERSGTEIAAKPKAEQPKPPVAASTAPQSAANEQPPAKIEVEIEIDFKNSTPSLSGKVTLEKEQTAFAALESFARQKELKVDFKGEGETLFVKGIGEVANQGAGGINWTYRVNGELGDRSSGIFSLKPGDKVLWIFGKYP